MRQALVKSIAFGFVAMGCQTKEAPSAPPPAPSAVAIVAAPLASVAPEPVHAQTLPERPPTTAKPGSASHTGATPAAAAHTETPAASATHAAAAESAKPPTTVAPATTAPAATAAATAPAATAALVAPATPSATAAAAASAKPPKQKSSLFSDGFNPNTAAPTAAAETKGTADTERRHRTTHAPTRPGAK
jgi:hypothetical protein